MADITDDEIIERVEKWFPKAKAFWEPHHTRFSSIKKFVRNHGEHGQWDDQEWTDRQGATVPRMTLTENLLGPFTAQVANDLKQSDFGANVKPKDSGTDPKLAKTRQGFHRGIQQIGGFGNARDRAIEDLIDGGLGAWRFITRATDPQSFQKEIEYLESDPVRLFHGDGSHRKSNFSDVTDSLYYEPYSKAKFKADFDKDPDSFLGKSDCSPVWGSTATGPWVSEYFFQQDIKETLVKCTEDPTAVTLLNVAKVRPGGSYYLSDFKAKLQEVCGMVGLKVEDFIAKDADGQKITRDTTRPQIWWAKIAHKQVLKKEKWPGVYIPNFLATGRSISINGDIKYYGLAEPARDVQRAHNYAFSALVERAGQAPKSQLYFPVEGMDPKYQKIYDNIAVWDGIVPYKSRDAKGAIDRPTERSPIQSDPAFINLRQMTLQGIRDVLGMWETSLGAQSNEKSGVAIQTRERQADTGNFDWGANFAKAAEHCFRATDEIANKVYDVATQIRIVGEDDKEDVIWAAALEEGDPNPNNYFDLNRGKYDIYCKMSPSADTKRDEQVKGMEMLFQNNPALAAGLAPEYIAIQDWKNAERMAEIAKKIRATQFPQVNFEEGDQQQQVPPQVQAALQQAQQQAQALQEELQKVKPEMDRAHQAEAKTAIENQSIKAQKDIEMRKLDLEDRKVRVTEFDADTNRLDVTNKYKLETGKLLLSQDELEHEKSMDEHEQLVTTSEHVHAVHQDRTATALQMNQQMHGQAQDKEKLSLEDKKLEAAKVSAKESPTGGKPGRSPSPRR